MLLYSLFLLFGSSLAVIVETKYGKVKGYPFRSRGGREVLSFSGIPYATPPLGTLRFMDPQPPKSYDGIIDVNTTLPCLYIDESNPLGTEDCLKLYVYTPSLNTKTLYPVLVYIHGGGWVQGAGQSQYGAQFFMDHDIVIVGIEFRVGVFGLLTLGNNLMPGNAELKDQVMALKWVQMNIAAFNGDPTRVTLMGQSAGAASVNFHMISPLSRGLFHAAVSESGEATAPWAFTKPETARKYALEIASILGCPNSDDAKIVKCLQNKKADDLLITASNNAYLVKAMDYPATGAFKIMFPVIDSYSKNSFIPVNPHLVESAPVPFITGINDLDGCFNQNLLRLLSHNLVRAYFQLSPQPYPYLLFYPNSTKKTEISHQIKQFYLNGLPSSHLLNLKDQFLVNLINSITDRQFGWPLLQAVNLHKGPTYVYNMAYNSKVSYRNKIEGGKDLAGSFHGDTTLLLWQQKGFTLDQNATALSKRFVKMFVDFVYSGNPTPPGASDFTWPLWNKVHQPFLTIDAYGNFREDHGFYPKRMQFWEELHKYAPDLYQF